MYRRVGVWLYDEQVGTLIQDKNEFIFYYREGYIGPALSLSLPLNIGVVRKDTLFPFFASLAPEGWLLHRYSQIQQLDEKDLFGMLIENGENLIGAVSLKLEVE